MNSLRPILLVAIIGLGQGCRHLAPPPPAEPPPYEARHVAAPLIIDGRLDETGWEQAATLRFMTFGSQSKPLSDTKARVVWDDTYLYVGFEAADKDVWSLLDQRDAWTCLEDVLEIFFKTDPDRTPYYNFEINALQTVYDAFSPDREFAGGYHRWERWNCPGLKVAVRVRGTLNNPDDVDEGWDMEVAIPFAALKALQGRPPRVGDSWRFHLGRYDYSVYLPDRGCEITTCAPLTGKKFNDPAGWMRLVFAKGDDAGKGTPR